MSTLLIDGDEYLFRACAGAETDIRWDDYNHVLQANEHEAWLNFTMAIERLKDRFKTEDIIMCFSGTYDTPNFRLAIDPSYKAGRADKRKPLCYAALREKADSAFRTQIFPGLEADDVLGILATKPGVNATIASQDKDMKTLPTNIWTGAEVLTITPEQADYWHMFQTLTGDAVDGYKGCPGMGPVGAAKALADKDRPHWASVVEAYEKKGLTEADALTQARLARILRWDDWDRQKKKPILWTPKEQTECTSI